MKLKSIFLALVLAGAGLQAGAAVPRAEYPRPQFERGEWQNLNGEWTYALDLSSTGWERNFSESRGFDSKIVVPFAPECKLSGVEYKDFIPSIWYQRNITIPAEWAGKNVVLNFGAVYYQSEIYIDGHFAGRHFGGSDSFSIDITRFVTPGQTHSLVVNANSDLRSMKQSAGKQSLRADNFECMYTRTTGIWQTVWMEAVSPLALERVVTTTDIDRSQVSFQLLMKKNVANGGVQVSVYDDGKLIAKVSGPAASGSVITVPLKKAKLWSPESPFLYDVVFEVLDTEGKVADKVNSYFGMRKVHIEGNKVYLNNKPYYQRLVLDQGFYPDGIWTAPSDEALKHDIEMSIAVGFNGARLHQKVFEERFYYWADKLGYLTWGEAPSWGLDANDIEAARNFISEWSNIVRRDLNHPSIVTWTPFNEEFWPDEVQYPRFISDIYDVTKMIDPTRPVNTVSGGIHIKTDIWTHHNYEQDAKKLQAQLFNEGKMQSKKAEEVRTLHKGNPGYNRLVVRRPYDFPVYDGSIPYIVDEFGGIRCMEVNPPQEGAWGYGSSPQTVEDFYQRLESQVRALIEIQDQVWGYCYTQLTDVQQEQNGVYYFDRRSKYDAERLKAIFGMSLEL
ncbi:MAG: beta-glucuronidase [Bacteroidales bacterium]|nr:beta-glucuronidase [Bacteroidales bacterium]